MKYVICLALTLAGAQGWAQQVPRGMTTDQVPMEADGPRKWTNRPSTTMQVPFGSGSAQADLLKAQTEAIKALSAKLDQLEARVNKLERGAR